MSLNVIVVEVDAPVWIFGANGWTVKLTLLIDESYEFSPEGTTGEAV